MDDLELQAEKIRAAGALGRSPVVQRLFDFLLARSRTDPPPKEVEVAAEVFGRAGGFDISQDSTVRVYVHRLRGKLDEFYRGAGREETVRLSIPKGEYRLVAVPLDPVEAASVLPRRRLPRWVLPAVVGLVMLNIVVGAVFWWSHNRAGFGFARHSPAWSALLHDDRPIILVVGDYYIFGESDENAVVGRMIREFDINSPQDLSDYLMSHPEKVGKYTDLDLHYLPTSTATALRNVMPLLAESPKARERIQVVPASRLTPDMLKRNNIVYVGYISGLGLLREPVFAGSSFRVGDNYDQLIDTQTEDAYVSQEGPRDVLQEMRLDYGYFAAFQGPDGNRIVVIAGTRDVAVMHTAETLTSREGILELKQKAKGQRAFEALYEVEALDRENLGGHLVTLRPRREAGVWAQPKSQQVFPKR